MSAAPLIRAPALSASLCRPGGGTTDDPLAATGGAPPSGRRAGGESDVNALLARGAETDSD